MNPFHSKLDENNLNHKEIIEFIEKDFTNQNEFEKYILNSFSIYFNEIPIVEW